MAIRRATVFLSAFLATAVFADDLCPANDRQYCETQLQTCLSMISGTSATAADDRIECQKSYEECLADRGC